MQGDGLRAEIAPGQGAELVSLRAGGRELLHRSSSGWRGGAPWLFPAVGRSFHAQLGRWAFQGRVYEMPIHGFVMERGWELVSADARAVVCRVRGDGRSRRLYPFDFELTVAYVISGRRLTARVGVAAAVANAGPMPFSIGNHLTLAVKDPSACVVATPAKERLLLDGRGLLTGKREAVSYDAGKSLAEDAMLHEQVLGGYEGEAWALVRLGGAALKVTQRGGPEPRFVFYSDGKSFLCPEPWCGEPNSLNTGRGIVSLPPGAAFDWEMELSLA